jgi:hypothetical protein
MCGHHAVPRTLVGNAFRQGFYWPTAVAEANEVVRTCEGCQFYARKTNLPAHAIKMIPVTWPFAMWGLDIVGPLRIAPGGYTHLLVVVDKFSKLVEACPITNLRVEQAVSFFTDIIHRIGVPNSIITDNGSQFTGRNSWSSGTNTTSTWTGRPSHIHRLMVRWSVPMTLSYKASSPEYSTG